MDPESILRTAPGRAARSNVRQQCPISVCSNPRPFVAASRSGGDDDWVETVARWTGSTPWTDRPLPTDRDGVILTARGPCLHAPGHRPLWWNVGLTQNRLARADRDPLVKALGLRPDETVLDCTLGLGHDAWVLAAAGAWVEAVEAVPALLLFTLDGLWRLGRTETRRIRARCGRYEAVLQGMADRAVDHVYVDPMFPTVPAGRSPQWTRLRRVARPGWIEASTLTESLRVARISVVLKLPPRARLPADLDTAVGLDSPRIVASKRMRYMVWSRR